MEIVENKFEVETMFSTIKYYLYTIES